MVGCNFNMFDLKEFNGTVSMPHAADGRLQQLNDLHGEVVPGQKFQCRTRQMVGCNDIEKVSNGLYSLRFNAARGKWSVATKT